MPINKVPEIVWGQKSITITIFVSLNLFVSNTNVLTISPNACDRNNQNPNVRPVFWDTSVCNIKHEEICFHCSISQGKIYVLLYSYTGFDKTAIYPQIELLAQYMLLWASVQSFEETAPSISQFLVRPTELSRDYKAFTPSWWKLSSLIPKISSNLSPWEEKKSFCSMLRC